MSRLGNETADGMAKEKTHIKVYVYKTQLKVGQIAYEIKSSLKNQTRTLHTPMRNEIPGSREVIKLSQLKESELQKIRNDFRTILFEILGDADLTEGEVYTMGVFYDQQYSSYGIGTKALGGEGFHLTNQALYLPITEEEINKLFHDGFCWHRNVVQ